MKTIDNFVHLLIHSMSRNEKGYFKKSLKIHSADIESKKYIILFDAIEQQHTYNELSLKNQFADELLSKQIAVTKNYLIKLILKSLVQYNGQYDGESILNRDLAFCDVLFKKGILKNYRQLLIKTKQKSYLYQKYDYALTIIKKEKQLLVAVKNKNMSKDLNVLLEEESKILNILQLENQLSYLYHTFLSNIHNSRIIRTNTEIEQLTIAVSQLPSETHILDQPFLCKSFYYGILIIYNYLKNNFLKVEELGLKYQQLFNNNPIMKNEKLDDYLEITYHIIGAKFQLEAFDDINNELNYIHKLKVEKWDTNQRKFFVYYANKIRLYASTYQYEKAILLMKDIRVEFPKIETHMAPNYKITILLNSSIMYFALGNYSDALDYLNEYFNNSNKGFRKDAYNFARIFYLFINLKLGNYILLENLLKNLKQEFVKVKSIFEYEKILFDFLKKITQYPSTKEKNKILLSTKNQLIAIKKIPIEGDAMRYFNFIRWMESEILNIPYHQFQIYLEKQKAKTLIV